MGYKLAWTLSTDNPKTGVIPTAWPTDICQAKESCQGCALLESRQCYAWYGSVARGLMSVVKGYEAHPETFTLKHCLLRASRRRAPMAKTARLGPIGDPIGADGRQIRRNVQLLRKEGIAILSYTHFWRQKRAERIQDFCRASCDSIEDGEQALAAGWAPAVLLPWDHDKATFWLGSTRGRVCPVQLGKDVTCDDCGACDVTRNKRPIGFIDHSHKARAKRLRMAGE